MTTQTISLAYRRAALQHASTVGLVIALCDTLAGNLTRAAVAMENFDIETRCAELVHGFKVLQQLDMMLDMERGGEAGTNIRRFYTRLRGQMLVAQFQLAPKLLHEQARLLLEIREAWQQVDSLAATAPVVAHPASAAASSSANFAPEQPGVGDMRGSFSCSG